MDYLMMEAERDSGREKKSGQKDWNRIVYRIIQEIKDDVKQSTHVEKPVKRERCVNFSSFFFIIKRGWVTSTTWTNTYMYMYTVLAYYTHTAIVCTNRSLTLFT